PTLLGSTVVNLAGQFSRSVQIPVTISAATRDVNYTVVVDSTGVISEPDETNNSVSGVIPFVPTVRASLASAAASPASVVQGQDVTVTVTARDDGTVPIFGARVSVDVFSGGQVIDHLPSVNLELAPGGTAVANQPWRARVPGTFTFNASLVVTGDLSVGDDN